MKRRTCLQILGGAAVLAPKVLFAAGRHDFVPAQLFPRGLSQAPYPSALRSLMMEVVKRTSIDADMDRADVKLDAGGIVPYPFLYLSGRESYDDFTPDEASRLRSTLDAGALLLADDASGVPNSAFDGWFRRQVEKIYPKQKLDRLPKDHTLFRSFYLIGDIGGRSLVGDAIEGITVGDLSPVLYCANDLGGAWAADMFGKPLFDCVPGGARQRENAVRLGVNIVMYTLCLNYKKERIHIETILQRRKLK